ncbi:hypothetical protein Purlil1_11512 [Purpureocillium lilacinum]|uniref:Uncharacterized protein n=1 Tax=Purpureocillium lilacinum TaxID=33203 RepID=A0ABR0BJR7_PURLI|nr:hypothetical protein Purlil1_11512 [Purpureocillium lilacinum]
MRCHTTQTFRQPASLEGILAHIDNSTTTVYAAEAQYQSQQTPVNIPRESQPSSTLPKPKGTPTTKRAGVKAAHGMPNSHKSRKAARDERRLVSNLTPAQLQRKRANDRRLQREYRARIQNTISSLEKEVQHLRGSQDNESTRELHQRNKALEKEVQVEKQLRTDDGETIHQLRQRIQALEKEMQDEKQLRINDSEAIRELHHGNQVLEKELEYQKQLRINDSKTIHQLRHRYQLGGTSVFYDIFHGLAADGFSVATRVPRGKGTSTPLLIPVEAKRSGVVAYLVVAVADLEASRKLGTRFTKARAHKAKKASLPPLQLHPEALHAAQNVGGSSSSWLWCQGRGNATAFRTSALTGWKGRPRVKFKGELGRV